MQSYGHGQREHRRSTALASPAASVASTYCVVLTQCQKTQAPQLITSLFLKAKRRRWGARNCIETPQIRTMPFCSECLLVCFVFIINLKSFISARLRKSVTFLGYIDVDFFVLYWWCGGA
jgi:hypothetical protein